MIQCFLLEETGQWWRYLRRFSDANMSQRCTPGGYGYCNAMIKVEELDHEPSSEDRDRAREEYDMRRYPRVCQHCGAKFTNEDQWQLFDEPVFRRSDTGELLIRRDAPPGAMFWADWLEGVEHWTSREHKARGNGPHLIVRLPDKTDWDIDGVATNSRDFGGWTRNGTPPKVTAYPSIQTGTWHGWLRDGTLVGA